MTSSDTPTIYGISNLFWFTDGTPGNGSVTQVGSLVAANAITKGGGAAQGTNYSNVNLTSGAPTTTTGTWTTIPYNTVTNAVNDDANAYVAGSGNLSSSRAAGVYVLTVTATFATNATGRRLVRWQSQGGSTFTQNGNTSAVSNTASATWAGYLAANYYLVAQCYQDSGGNLAVAVNSSTTPTSAAIVQVA
jgi:hypothetical protein